MTGGRATVRCEARAARAAPVFSRPFRRRCLFRRAFSSRRAWAGIAPLLLAGLAPRAGAAVAPRPGLAALAALALVLLLSATPGARADVLISNFTSTATSNGVSFDTNGAVNLAQGFGTGGHAAGYTLTSLEVAFDGEIDATDIADLTASVWTADASGNPETKRFDLTNPASISRATFTGPISNRRVTGNYAEFTAPAAATLEASTAYLLVLTFDEDRSLWVTVIETEAGFTGWSIVDGSRSKRTGESWTTVSDKTMLLRVNGAPRGADTIVPPSLPAVSGTARVGETLTASTADIRDTEGLTTPGWTYQWVRVDADGSSNPTDIDGATSSTYVLAAADAGKKVKVRVSYTDDDSNAETLTSAAFPMHGTIAMAVPGMEDPADVSTATLTVQDLGADNYGCSVTATDTAKRCDAALSANTFTINSATYTFSNLIENNGSISLVLSGRPPLTVERTHHLELTKASTTSRLRLSTGLLAQRSYLWQGTDQDWAQGDTVTVKIVKQADVTPPELASEAPEVLAPLSSRLLAMSFTEDLDHDNRPPASAFTVTADGRNVPVLAVSGTDAEIELRLASTISAGQAVTVSYADPTSGDDTAALQDRVGNDVATFENIAVRRSRTGSPSRRTARRRRAGLTSSTTR